MFFFFREKSCGGLGIHDMVIRFYSGRVYRLKYLLEKELWNFDAPTRIYRPMMFKNNENFVICPEMGFFSWLFFFFMTKNCLCSKLPTKCTKYQQNLFFALFCPIMSHYDYEKSFEKFRTSSLRIRYFHPIWCITWWSYASPHSDWLRTSKWGKIMKTSFLMCSYWLWGANNENFVRFSKKYLFQGLRKSCS